jgi:hypothetical protein
MAADNAEFRKRVDEAKARMEKLDELRVMVIKGHTIVEEAMGRFLDSALSHPSYLLEERPTFHFRGKLAESLALKEDKDSLWAVFWAINYLRNKIAHQIDSKEIDDNMKHLRKTYIAQLGSRQVVKRRHKAISHSEIVTIADHGCQKQVGSKQRLLFGRRWRILRRAHTNRVCSPPNTSWFSDVGAGEKCDCFSRLLSRIGRAAHELWGMRRAAHAPVLDRNFKKYDYNVQRLSSPCSLWS